MSTLPIPNESSGLPSDTSLPACVSDYLNTLEQWAHIKAERARREREVIEWLQAHNSTTIEMPNGSRLRLSEENIRNPLNKDQMVTGLQAFFRAALPALQMELNASIEQVSSAITCYLWTLRSGRRVAKIRRLPNACSSRQL